MNKKTITDPTEHNSIEQLDIDLFTFDEDCKKEEFDLEIDEKIQLKQQIAKLYSEKADLYQELAKINLQCSEFYSKT